MNVWTEKPSTTLPTKHQIPPPPQPPKTILQAYKTVFTVMRFFGSSNFKVTSKPTKDHPTVMFKPTKTKLVQFKYVSTKIAMMCYLIFFIARFVSMIFCKNSTHCVDKGVLLLSISCYIQQTMIVLGIYSWTHWKRGEISIFFERFNELDLFVFDGDTPTRQKFLRKHHQIYIRVKIYFPIMAFLSIVLIGINHWNHPLFMAHMTSLFLVEGQHFFSSFKTTVLTIFSFSCEFLLVIYSYLALYQFLFFSIIVERSFKWCLEHLNTPTSHDFKTVQFKVQKYEHVRSLMTQYNDIFSGLLCVCKAGLVLQLVVGSYVPLKRMYSLPLTSLMIFGAVVVHSTVQVVVLLTEMGNVYKASGEFRNSLVRGLGGDLVGGGEFGVEDVTRVYRLRCLVDGCKGFGFTCGGCYVVGGNTILTFFSIVTSYLIVMFQLQI